MASAVQWIKVTTDIFDDEKILFIESQPNSDSVIIIWFKLLCLAGKQNNKGVLMFNNVPYTPQMLSTIFRRDVETISNALNVFKNFGMIHYENNAIAITNWGKHQTLDKLEANKAYMREYMKDYRKKQRDVANGKVNDKVNGKVKINSADKEIDKEIDKDKEQNKIVDIHKENISSSEQSSLDYKIILDSFHSICKSLPKVVKFTDKRLKALESAQQVLGEVTFEKFFEKIEESDFLAGRKGTWRCDFDWIFKTENIIKILEGNYDNRSEKRKADYSDVSKYNNMKMEV